MRLIQTRYQLDNIFRDYILLHSIKGNDFVIWYQSLTSSGYCRAFFIFLNLRGLNDMLELNHSILVQYWPILLQCVLTWKKPKPNKPSDRWIKTLHEIQRKIRGKGREEGGKNPTEAAAGRRVGRLGNGVTSRTSHCTTDGALSLFWLWKILARCWGCPLSPLPSFYIVLAIINQSDCSPQSI